MYAEASLNPHAVAAWSAAEHLCMTDNPYVVFGWGFTRVLNMSLII